MTSRPSIDGPLNLFDEGRLERLDGTARRAARGILVAAAAELFGYCADVDVALRSHADAVGVAFRLLEEDDGLDFLDGQRLVDQAFGVVVRAASGASHRKVEKE